MCDIFSDKKRRRERLELQLFLVVSHAIERMSREEAQRSQRGRNY